MKYHTVLCCVNASHLTANVDEYTFYQLFNPVTPVKNVKVFCSNVQVKAFVQVTDAQAVELLVDQFHLKHLNIGRLKVYVSHKKFVAFDRSLKSILAGRDNVPNANPLEPERGISVEKSLTNQYISNSLANKIGTGTKLESNEKRNFSNFFLYSHNFDDPPRLQAFSRDSHLKEPGHVGNKSRFARKPSLDAYCNKNTGLEDKTSKANWKPGKSSLLRIANINSKVVTSKMLVNLFGCFGNVITLALNAPLGTALIEFSTKEQCLLAHKFVNNLLFFGNTLSLTITVSDPLIENGEKGTPTDIEYIKCKSKNFRYKPNSGVKINKPSRTLHFASAAPSMTLDRLRQLIVSIHEPVKMAALGKKGGKSEMFLAEFKHQFQSLEVLSQLHNKKTEGKPLKVSFSHTEIEDA